MVSKDKVIVIVIGLIIVIGLVIFTSPKHINEINLKKHIDSLDNVIKVQQTIIEANKMILYHEKVRDSLLAVRQKNLEALDSQRTQQLISRLKLEVLKYKSLSNKSLIIQLDSIYEVDNPSH